MNIPSLFDISGQTALVTGGSGVLGGAMARGLAGAGARVLIMGRRPDACERVAAEIRATGGAAEALPCDTLDKAALGAAAAKAGAIDILVNGAGGNQPKATTSPTQRFFDLEETALRAVFDANFTGVLLTTQAFGRGMAERGRGVIVNISSMAAIRPLTRTVGYAAAKAAVDNFTFWLAVHLAQEYSSALRVNAIAPGFFLGEQNRALLIDQTSGKWTPRGESIIKHTPMARLGEPDELVGTLLWLVSPASAFVTGIVVPVDGGYSAFSGI